jgi:hypothetical protein
LLPTGRPRFLEGDAGSGTISIPGTISGSGIEIEGSGTISISGIEIEGSGTISISGIEIEGSGTISISGIEIEGSGTISGSGIEIEGDASDSLVSSVTCSGRIAPAGIALTSVQHFWIASATPLPTRTNPKIAIATVAKVKISCTCMILNSLLCVELSVCWGDSLRLNKLRRLVFD